jgi:hypothetical protein
MSDATVSRPAPIRADTIIIGILAVLAIAALAYLLSQRQQELRRSPVGLDGLQIWVASEGASVQSFTGGWLLDPTGIGLLVLPLYDTIPGQDREPPLDKTQLLFQQDENDLDWQSLQDKIVTVPSLVVLPKWRSGMRLTGIAHPALLVDESRLSAFLRSLTGEANIGLTRIRQVFTSLPYRDSTGQDRTAKLYASQLFDGSTCDPIIGSGPQTLLASCPVAGSDMSVLILSDPDLLNNHGLRLGQNADIARDLLTSAAADRSVVIDYSRDNWLASTDKPIQRDRTWADLLRFFQPPFLAVWIGALLTLTLVLWRSFRRAGPVASTTTTGGSKLQAIRSRARLMRLTGQDGAMLSDYAAARIAATAARLVGPGHARQIGDEQAFLRYLARRRPVLSSQLADVVGRLKALPPRIPATLAIHHVEDLEQILELIANDP